MASGQGPKPNDTGAHGVMAEETTLGEGWGGFVPPGPTGTAADTQRSFFEAKANPPGWKEIHEYVHPGNLKVRVALFWVKNIPAAEDLAPRYVEVASRMLKEHGLHLDVYPGPRKDAVTTLDYVEEVFLPDQVEKLRDLAHQKFDDKGKDKRLPVIFCNFKSAIGDEKDIGGHTEKKLKNWLPFVLINNKIKLKDGVTLLHEIGHAASCGHERYDSTKDEVVNFMSTGHDTKRTDMLRNQIRRIGKVYFTGK